MKKFIVLLALLFAWPALAQTPSQPLTSKLDITTATVVKPAQGILICFNVTTAGAVGAIYDLASTSGVGATNLIAVIPAVVGVYCGEFPFFAGLVVVPGAAQVVSVSLR